MRQRLLVILMLVVPAFPAIAQNAARHYLPNPSDEDWSFLATSPDTDRWDPLKYIPLEKEQWFLTLSGEARLRPEWLRIRATDTRPAIADDYLLQRYLFGADLHAGTHARVFVELQSGIINGSIRSPRTTDLNTLDLHQAFFSWQQTAGEQGRVSIKAGRQELSIGSSRLISASPGLNVKRSFDGFEVSYVTPGGNLTGAAARLVSVDGGSFDDRTDAGQPFWGVAAGRRGPLFQKGELSGYYLGIKRRASQYYQGIGSEQRGTLGLKWTGTGTRGDLNYDALFQWGTFAGAPIRAWAFATETGYRLSLSGWRPRLSVQADVASGDHNRADPRLQSFNPLFPGNSYAGAIGLLGPTNLTDLTPALTVTLRRNMTLGIEAPSYWRTSTADAVYTPDQRPLFPPGAGAGRYVGTNPGVYVVWQVTAHVQVQGVVTRFLSGEFLSNTIVRNGFGFYSASGVYRF